MATLTLNGISAMGKDSLGGLRRIWMAPYSTDAYTVALDEVTPKAGIWKQYHVRKATSGVTTTATIDDPNGILFYTSDISLKFSQVTKDKRDEIKLLMKGDLCVVVEDNNGKFFAYGVDSPVTSTAGTASLGIAYTDFNGYEITLQDVSRELPVTTTEPTTV